MNDIKKLSGRQLFLDALVILLNISTSYSIVPYLVFGFVNRYVNILFIVVINLLYLAFPIRRNINSNKSVRIGLAGKGYIVVMITCFFTALLTNTGYSSVLVHLLQNVSFLFVLYKIYNTYLLHYSQEQSFFNIVRPYCILILISATGALLLFILLKLGIISPYQNNISNKFDLFGDNVHRYGSQYYYPLFLSIIETGSIDARFPFFSEYGMIDGLFHEPHCMTFISFPAFFLMLYYSPNRKDTIFIWLLFIVQLCLAGSTTNIMACLGCLIVYCFYIFKSSISKTIYVIATLIIVFGFVALYIDWSTFNFILDKMESGSMTYSVSTMDFALHPRTLFGTSFLNINYVNSSTLAKYMDVGYIPFILNILFLCFCLKDLINLFRSSKRRDMFVLLACCYFFMHSAKVAMVAYSLSMLVFIIFILEISQKRYNHCGQRRARYGIADYRSR